VKYERAPRGTRVPRRTLAVTSPRSPFPSGLHARLQSMPRVAKFSKTWLENCGASDPHVLSVNWPAAAGLAWTSAAAPKALATIAR
jgi:hypothetical protein